MADAEPASIGDLLRWAAYTRPDRIALVAGTYRPTWAQLDEDVTRTAHALLAAGAQPGDRVALQIATGADFVPLYLGALRAGFVAVPLNPGYPVPELRQVLADADASLLVTTTLAASLAAAELPSREVLVAGTQAPEGLRTVAELPAPADDRDPRADRTGEELAVLLYTSGASGRPRGAMLSARALLANLAQLAAVEPPVLRADDVAYVPVPLSHVFGLNAGLGLALHAGATAVVGDRFDVEASLALMATERTTVVVGVPSMFAAWAEHPDFARGFATVRLAVSGAAPLPPELVRVYARVGVPLREGYGLTEAAPVVTLCEAPTPGAVGRPLPGVEVQLRDSSGEPAEDGDPGELFVRGANLFSGYWPDGAGGPGPDGWWGTGDMAVTDADGVLRIVGRTTDLVIVNGFNVYPTEVEAVLRALPGVAEAAAVGVPDAQTGEAVHAYVIPAPGATLDPAWLGDRAAEALATFKLPRRIEIVDRLPHTVTGKVMKARLTGSEGTDAAR